MTARALVVALLVVAAGVTVWLLQGPSDTELAVRAALEGAVDAVERGDAEGLAEYLAADYRDRLRHDDQTVVRRVMRERRLWDALEISLHGLDVAVDEELGIATTTFRLEMRGDSLEDPEIKARYDGPDGRRFRIHWRRHGGLWLVRKGEVIWSLIDSV